MKTKTTLVLLGLVLALGLWIKFYESQRPNTVEAKRQAGNVLNFERDHLEGIEIQNGEEMIALRRIDGKWRLEAPIKDQADGPMVETLLAHLENWEKDATITAQEIGAEQLEGLTVVEELQLLRACGDEEILLRQLPEQHHAFPALGQP